jgi:hypothetical protein
MKTPQTQEEILRQLAEAMDEDQRIRDAKAKDFQREVNERHFRQHGYVRRKKGDVRS